MRYFSLPDGGLEAVLRLLMESGEAEAVLAPLRRTGRGIVGPSLIADPQKLSALDVHTPVSAVNQARILSEITRPGAASTVAAVLRPCEIRSLVELHKLRQADLNRVIILGLDCLGAVPSSRCEELDTTPDQWLAALSGGEEGPGLSDAARELCLSCTDLEAPHADIGLNVIGSGGQLLLAADGGWADRLAGLDLEEMGAPPGRAAMLDELRARRRELRAEAMATALTDIADHDRFQDRFLTCLKCGNCREMCPICYCRQCVFETPDFVHEPGLYIKWAGRHGQLDIPSEVALFHMTRLNHMALSCVGCGHCSSACPHDLPVATLFYALGQKARELFDYEPGRDPDEPHPFQTFKEEELEPR